MDYEAMDARQLQQACRERGLPTARDKATMLARLVGADAAVVASPVEAPAVPAVEQHPAAPAAPGVWRASYPAAGFLGDEEHRSNCARVAAAAEAAGYRTRGSGRRVRTAGGVHMYEVFVR